jgi:uncharacterized membrane protein
MALLYIAAGINHFWHPRFYLRLMPPYLPAPLLLNGAAGVAEILLGFLLLSKSTRPFAAWSIAVMLTLFMLVHVYMLQQSLRQPQYFVSPAAAWLRLLIQPLLIAWALWYTKPL